MRERVQQSIKNYRKAKNLTLKMLADKAGCTPSFVSQVEKGLTVPSLSMIGKLAAAMDISVIDLFANVADKEINNRLLKKVDRRLIYYPDGKVESQLLTTGISTKKMEPLISYIKPGGSSDEAEEMTHPVGTEEVLLILKGTLHMEVFGKKILLQKGDSLYFDGTIPHRWINKGKKPAEVLFIFTPPIW